MKLSEIFFALSSGEMSTLNCVENGEIRPESYNKVISAINRGLTCLGTRFMLRKDVLLFKTIAGMETYVIDPEFTETSGNPDAYILDMDHPFIEGLLEITALYQADGTQVALDGSAAVLRTTVKTLRFKQPVEDAVYKLHYSALPYKIEQMNGSGFDPENIEVDLPIAYLNALVYFVASAFYSPSLSGLDGARANQDVNYRQLFEAECRVLESKGLDVDEDLPTDLFSQRGFL